MQIATLPVSHFPALLIFAALASLALACLTHRTTAARIKYVAWSFALFVVIAVGIAWAMYPLSH
jgi:hypothetical protein